MGTVFDSVPHKKCTGCSACYNSCPVHAIVMKENKEGFLYPERNQNPCIQCESCIKHCPVCHVQYTNTENPICLASYAKDEIRLKSASGGIYAAFASYLIEQGGYISGAVYDKNWNVRHIVGNSNDVFEQIRSSKYLQSDIGTSYQEIKQRLEDGKEVLFGGTPCQVAGLYGYLDKKYEKLYTMDVICHGVPSPKVFQKYLRETWKVEQIKKIDFREKDYFGWSTELTVLLEGGEIVRKRHEEDAFFRSFLSCLALRSACESCPFSAIPRQGDLSIGDFWGIDAYDPMLNDKKGISVVLVNNRQGKKMIDAISDKLSVTERVPIEYAARINKTIKEPFSAHFGRKHFFSMLDILPMEKLVEHALHNHYDIGILGLWYGLNYGSILTYYALYETLKQYGFDPLLLAKPYFLWNERYADRNSIAGRFIYPRCNVMNDRGSDYDWILLNQHCDMFLVGSDVVWNYEICGRDAGSFFFMDFVKSNKKKIAYASSFGAGYFAPAYEQARDAYYFKRLDAVSVREKEAAEICKKEFQVHADVVLDPVFLCKRAVFDEIADSVSRESEHFITAYLLGADEEKKSFLQWISEKMQLKIHLFLNPNTIKRCKEIMQMETVKDDSVESWLSHIKYCDFYMGDSFHGLCFSLIFQKNFICIVSRDISGVIRFQNLLSLCGLEERLVYEDTPYEEILEVMKRPIDYKSVNKRLQKPIADSENWLKEALEKPKRYSYSEEDRIFELEEKLSRLWNRKE